MIKLLIAAIAILASCQKSHEDSIPKCVKACAISEKFRADTSLIKTDTLWKDPNLCGRWIDTIRKQQPSWTSWVNCPPPVPSMPDFVLEKITYIIY